MAAVGTRPRTLSLFPEDRCEGLLPGLEWDELLNEALLRALDGSRCWPEGMPLLSFIAGIMRGLLEGRAQQRRRLAGRPAARAPVPDVMALIAGLARQVSERGRPSRAAAQPEAPRGRTQAPRPRHSARPTR